MRPIQCYVVVFTLLLLGTQQILTNDLIAPADERTVELENLVAPGTRSMLFQIAHDIAEIIATKRLEAPTKLQQLFQALCIKGTRPGRELLSEGIEQARKLVFKFGTPAMQQRLQEAIESLCPTTPAREITLRTPPASMISNGGSAYFYSGSDSNLLLGDSTVGHSVTSGGNNTSVGAYALVSIAEGDDNTALGYAALGGNVGGVAATQCTKTTAVTATLLLVITPCTPTLQATITQQSAQTPLTATLREVRILLLELMRSTATPKALTILP
ncbi:hypothetical protein EBZ39_13370 [bacterium]|nr:hypothetical protein [bacterium]